MQLIHCHLLLPLHRIATVTLQRFQWFYDSCSSQSLMSLAATGTRNLPWASIQLYLWCYAIEGDAFEAYPSFCLHNCAKSSMECPGHSMVSVTYSCSDNISIHSMRCVSDFRRSRPSRLRRALLLYVAECFRYVPKGTFVMKIYPRCCISLDDLSLCCIQSSCNIFGYVQLRFKPLDKLKGKVP